MRRAALLLVVTTMVVPGAARAGASIYPEGATVRNLPRHPVAIHWIRRTAARGHLVDPAHTNLVMLDYGLTRLPAQMTSAGASIGIDRIPRNGSIRRVAYLGGYGQYDVQPDQRIGGGLRLGVESVNYLSGASIGERTRWTEAMFTAGIPVHMHWDDQWSFEAIYLWSRRSNVFFKPGRGHIESLTGIGVSFEF